MLIKLVLFNKTINTVTEQFAIKKVNNKRRVLVWQTRAVVSR